jgi:hypothetical protein
LCPRADYCSQETYYPRSYDTLKYTPATHAPERLVETANCFYSDTSKEEDWICLEIDVVGLKVNGIEMTMVDHPSSEKLKCPHIFGGVPRECIRNVYEVKRNASDGTFESIPGLTDATCVRKTV